MATSAPGQGPRHRLLPHERWLADAGARRGPAPQGSDRWRMQQNYGPEGLALVQAGFANLGPGWLIAIAGIVLQFIGAGGSTLADILIGIGLIIMVAGLVRYIQAGRAGRIYRNGRAFIRAGGR